MPINAEYRGPGDLPTVIPVFPLPGALLLPRGQMPLNIFEPRYLAMIDDALRDGHRLIGMIQPDAAHAGPGSRAWQATAVLTKAKVDTHLFTRFHYAQPLDLSDADCISIETWVPDGQTTPNQILAIIHEEGGGDFLAETGRSLAAPGWDHTFVALNRFKLAGWSQDADGILDLKKVSDILIGWGGYLGAESEKVQFSVALPQVGVVLQSHK